MKRSLIKWESYSQKHKHLQTATCRHTDQSLQKSVLLPTQ